MRNNSEEREDAEEAYVKERGGSWSIMGRYGMDLGSILVDPGSISGRSWVVGEGPKIDLLIRPSLNRLIDTRSNP